MPTALIPLAEGCEELEAVTVIDLLRRAEIEVTTAGLSDGPVTASRRTVLVPDKLLESVAADRFDLIALPGGLPGATRLAESQVLAECLEAQHQRQGWIGAVCAAPAVLARHGLLDGRRATAFPGALDEYAEKVTVTDEPVVVDGHLVTSRGPGTAMDFALLLIELLRGESVRERVEAALQRPRYHTIRQLPAH